MATAGIELNGYGHLQQGGGKFTDDPPPPNPAGQGGGGDIRKVRQALRLGQDEIARETGLTQQTISLIERGITSRRAKSSKIYFALIEEKLANARQQLAAAAGDEKSTIEEYSDPTASPSGAGGGDPPHAPNQRRRRQAQQAVHVSKEIVRSVTIDPGAGHVVVTLVDPDGHSFSYAITSVEDNEAWLKFHGGVGAMAPPVK